MNPAADRRRPRCLPLRVHGVHNPHHDPANQQRASHDVQAFEVLPDYLRQQKRWHCRHHKRHAHQPQRVRQNCPVASLALRKCGQKCRDALAKIHWQAQNCPQLNHDRVHLPIAVRQIDVKQRFTDAQMRRRAHRQKLRQSLHDPQQHGQQVVAQIISPGCFAIFLAPGRIFRISYASIFRK